MTLPGALAELAGSWAGTKAVIEPDQPRHESSCTASVAAAMEGQFLELRYAWAFDGQPQSGLLLVHVSDGAAKAVWFDSWHNADTWMTLAGSSGGDASVDLRGTYPAGDGPDWGWRIVVTGKGGQLGVDMYNITPDGQEMIGVEMRLGRALMRS